METENLLTDEQMAQFITKGFVVLKNDLPESFHQHVMKQIDYVMNEEGNPGNNILPRVPEIGKFFDTPVVRGALTSVLGKDYYMHPHRHCHYNRPKEMQPGGGKWHKDGYWSSMRSHRPWWAIIFYYTQDITHEMGPTAVMPGTQYYDKFLGDQGETVLPTGKAGTMVLVHFDLWHRASLNVSNMNRYMLKFQFVRLQASEYPTWNHQNETLAVPEGLPAQHMNLWQDVWDWLRGESQEVQGESPSVEAGLFERTTSGLEGTTSGSERTTAGSVSELGDLLGGPSEIAALNASYELGRMGTKGVNELVSRITDESHQVAERAVYGLQAAGTSAIPGLLRILEHEDPKKRGFAAFALGMIGPSAGKAVPTLISSLNDESDWVRRNAVEALGMIGEPSDQVVPAITKALINSIATEDEDRERAKSMTLIEQKYIGNKIGYTAALSLLRIGHKGDPKLMVDALGKSLMSSDRYVRAYAAEALTHLRTPEAVDLLIRYYRTSRWCPDTSKASMY